MPIERRTSWTIRGIVWLLLIVSGSGCSKGPKLVPVEGRVVLEAHPARSIIVTFSPVGETGGVGGHGFTDNDGQFVLSNARGGKGIQAGTYFVSLMASAVPAKQGDPLDVIGKAGDTSFPSIYMDPGKTQLRAIVPENGGTAEIVLTKSGVGATAKITPKK